jgi:hypothetical protein
MQRKSESEDFVNTPTEANKEDREFLKNQLTPSEESLTVRGSG